MKEMGLCFDMLNLTALNMEILKNIWKNYVGNYSDKRGMLAAAYLQQNSSSVYIASVVLRNQFCTDKDDVSQWERELV